uniref:Secreted protein n=1 Tax=Salarias fasciatus TaxID=181472 RepID=A0A672IBL8_SALFA
MSPRSLRSWLRISEDLLLWWVLISCRVLSSRSTASRLPCRHTRRHGGGSCLTPLPLLGVPGPPSHRFVCQLLVQLQVAAVLVLHLLALVVVVDGQLLQRLQDLLHLVFSQVAVLLEAGQLVLQPLVVLATRQDFQQIFNGRDGTWKTRRSSSPFLQRFSSFSSFWIITLRLRFFSFSFSYFFFHSSAVSSRFTDTVFLMVLALKQNKRPSDVTKHCVDLVSASLYTDGEQQMMMVVRQFPPRESCRIRVILLSRYGT